MVESHVHSLSLALGQVFVPRINWEVSNVHICQYWVLQSPSKPFYLLFEGQLFTTSALFQSWRRQLKKWWLINLTAALYIPGPSWYLFLVSCELSVLNKLVNNNTIYKYYYFKNCYMIIWSRLHNMLEQGAFSKYIQWHQALLKADNK